MRSTGIAAFIWYSTAVVLLSTAVLLLLYWYCTAFYCCFTGVVLVLYCFLLLFYCYCTGVVLLLYWLWTGLVLDRDWTGIGRVPATRPCYQLLYGLLLEAG